MRCCRKMFPNLIRLGSIISYDFKTMIWTRTPLLGACLWKKEGSRTAHFRKSKHTSTKTIGNYSCLRFQNRDLDTHATSLRLPLKARRAEDWTFSEEYEHQHHNHNRNRNNHTNTNHNHNHNRNELCVDFAFVLKLGALSPSACWSERTR